MVVSDDQFLHTEAVYQESQLDVESLSDEEIIGALCEYPSLLQRPIVVTGDRAVIGRPPAKVLEIIA